MENASKALLIAGAVLIVILLIGIGMLIYSRSTGVIDTAANAMNAQQIQAFNSQFTPYEGKQPGSSVRTMISAVIANNGAYSNNDDKKVGIGYHKDGDQVENTTSQAEINNIIEHLDSTHEYSIKFVYRDNGLIKTVSINY